MTPRFARVVERVTIKQARDGMGPVVSREIARTLLQREHAAVVRKVKAMETIAQHITAQRGDELISRKDLLAWLDGRGR